MSGQWRVIVDSWITPEATWAGRAVYIVSGEHVHSLPAALQAIAESPPQVYLSPVVRGEMLNEPAPAEFTVPVCGHGRGCSHNYGPCVECGDSEHGHRASPASYDHQWHGSGYCLGPEQSSESQIGDGSRLVGG